MDLENLNIINTINTNFYSSLPLSTSIPPNAIVSPLKNNIAVPQEQHFSHRSGQSKIILLLVLFILLSSSCTFFGDRTSGQERRIARVYDTYLYESDLAGLVNENLSPKDSVELINYHVDNWIRHQLMLAKADKLTQQHQKDIDRRLKNYKESLLLFMLEQELVKQQVDTSVSNADIQQYFEENKEGFLLRDDIVKVTYLILPNEAPKIDFARNWLKEPNTGTEQEMKEYCIQYAVDHALNPKWFQFKNFSFHIPIGEIDAASFLKNRAFFETKDAVHTYLVNIHDYGLKNQTSPIDYKKQDIEKIIVNKRKMEYIKNLKDKIYRNALEQGSFEVY